MPYRSARVLVTGGLGFLGSNLVLRLLAEGARVTVVDSLVPGCGGQLSNLGSDLSRVTLIQKDIAEADQYAAALANVDVVFNLAGEISHIQSMLDPERDLLINAQSQLRFLLALRKQNRGVRVVYAGTRQIYGRPQSLPVSEDHTTSVVDFNGVHKLAAAQYHAVLTGQGDLDAIELRLTNIYGPRLALHVPGQGFLSVFLRKATQAEPIEVFGDGSQFRDPLFVDDAIEAFLRAGAEPKPRSRIYNLGGGKALTLLEIAEEIGRQAGSPHAVRFRPFPPGQLSWDIGSYQADCTRIQSELGWRPTTPFAEGIRASLHYFRASHAA